MKRIIFILVLLAAGTAFGARQILLNQDTAYDAFTAADDNFLELYTSMSASTVTVDLGDDGGDDTTTLEEIATTGDTNSVFSVLGNKLTIAVGNNWPTADSATTANTANSATTATTATTANAGDSATSFFSSGTVEVAVGGTGQATAQAAINALTAVAAATDEYILTKDTSTGNAIWKANPGAGSGTVDTTGTVNANEFARFSDSDTLEALTAGETRTALSIANVEDTALSTWAGTANIVTVGTITTGGWGGTTIPVNKGGTGATTAQAAIDALTAVSAATDEYILTKDTATGNAIWKVNPGAGSGTVDTTGVVNANEFAQFSDADTLRALTAGELKAAIDLEIGTDVLAQQTIGIANDNLVETDMVGIADNDYAKFTANGLEGRSYSEVKTDLSLGSVENTALSTWAGTANITTLGTVSTGGWGGTAIPLTKGGTGDNTSAWSGVLAVSSGSIREVDSKSELEAQIADVSDFAEADGDIYTGTHDFHSATLKAENVYAYDASGIIFKDDANTTALTVLDGANVQVANKLGIGTTPSYPFHLLHTSTTPYAMFDYAYGTASGFDLLFKKRRSTDIGSAVSSDNDIVARMIWRWVNDAFQDVDSPVAAAYVLDASDGTEDTAMYYACMLNGTNQNTLSLVGASVGVNDTTPSTTLDVGGGVRADSYTEYSPVFTDGQAALAMVDDMQAEPGSIGQDGWGDIDHSTLPSKARKSFTETWVRAKNGKELKKGRYNGKKEDITAEFEKVVEGRDIGVTVQILQAAIKELNKIVKAQQAEIDKLKK